MVPVASTGPEHHIQGDLMLPSPSTGLTSHILVELLMACDDRLYSSALHYFAIYALMMSAHTALQGRARQKLSNQNYSFP